MAERETDISVATVTVRKPRWQHIGQAMCARILPRTGLLGPSAEWN